MLRAWVCAGCLLVSTAQAAEPKAVVLVPQAVREAKLAPAPEPRAADDGIATRWWFWTLVGVVAGGAIAGAAIAVGAPQPRSTTLPDGDLRRGGT